MKVWNLVIAMLILIFSHSAIAQAPAGTIEGTVIRMDTGQPISGAQVGLAAVNNPATGAASVGPLVIGGPAASAPRPADSASITTGADGKFSFKDLAAGRYLISVTATGFLNQQYGQRSFPGQGRPLFLAAGQSVRGATIRMSATGTISGRVFDENGQPATGAPVQLIRVAYAPLGNTFVVMGTATVDDRGDYRLFAMIPGRYYLVAGTPPGPPRGGGPVSAPRYSMVYYPASPDLDRASTVEVKSGEEATFDLRVRRQTQTYKVRGRIVDTIGMGLPPSLDLALVYKSFNSGGAFSNGRSFDPATNVFELQNVAPGDYLVLAQLPRDRQAEQTMRPLAHAPIHVVDADIDGVVLHFSRGVTASGRFVIEGQPLSVLTNLQQMSLVFNAADMQLPDGLPAALPTTPDGAFQVAGLRDGVYRIQLRGAPPAGIYLKSIHYDGEDILTKPLKFAGSSPGIFEVTFRFGASQLEGTVRNARAEIEPGIMVVLIPNERSRTNDYRIAGTDQNGHFQMSGLAPGEYKLFSWEALDQLSLLNPDFVRPYEQQGLAVRVTESSNQKVEVRMIPSQ